MKYKKKTNLRFSHFLQNKDFNELKILSISDIYESPIPKDSFKVNLDFLRSLENNSGITLNNIILSDRVLRELDIDSSYRYIEVLARELMKTIEKVKPLYIIGSWDAAIQGVAMLISKKMNIPFVISKFSVIPANYLTFCTYPNNFDELPFTNNNFDEVLAFSEKIFKDWTTGFITAPAYISTRTPLDIIKRIPSWFTEILRRIKINRNVGFNKYVYFSYYQIFKQFLRKKTNVILLNKKLFISKAPVDKYVFYGLHMQPESTTDVMAPFYTNQFELLKNASKAIPAGYKLLIKVHISDADNYSNDQLKKLLKIPNSSLVSPFVSSKEFIQNADLILSIQGTIGMEGALLGKPVIMFGNSSYLKFSTVEKCGKIEDLPLLIENQLKLSKPHNNKIIQDFANLLMNYLPSCNDDWTITLKNGLSDTEKNNFINIFNQLTNYIESSNHNLRS